MHTRSEENVQTLKRRWSWKWHGGCLLIIILCLLRLAFLFTCEGLFLSAPGGLGWKMTDNVRWTDDKCRLRFIGFPFKSTALARRSDFPSKSAQSAESEECHKNSRTEEKGSEGVYLRDPVCHWSTLLLSADQFLIPSFLFQNSICPLTPSSFSFLSSAPPLY